MKTDIICRGVLKLHPHSIVYRKVNFHFPKCPITFRFSANKLAQVGIPFFSVGSYSKHKQNKVMAN